MSIELATKTPEAPAWTAEQRSLADEFLVEYGIDADQITFTDETLNPIFDFDALFFLANQLGDFWDISIEAGEVDHERGYCTSQCCIMLGDSRTRKMFGSAFIGETMPGGAGGRRRGDLEMRVKMRRAWVKTARKMELKNRKAFKELFFHAAPYAEVAAQTGRKEKDLRGLAARTTARLRKELIRQREGPVDETC